MRLSIFRRRILLPLAVKWCVARDIKTALPLPACSGDLLAIIPNLDHTAEGASERIVALITKVPGRRISRRQMTEKQEKK